MRRNNHINTRQVIQYCISMRSIGHQNSMRRIRILPKKLLHQLWQIKSTHCSSEWRSRAMHTWVVEVGVVRLDRRWRGRPNETHKRCFSSFCARILVENWISPAARLWLWNTSSTSWSRSAIPNILFHLVSSNSDPTYLECLWAGQVPDHPRQPHSTFLLALVRQRLWWIWPVHNVGDWVLGPH